MALLVAASVTGLEESIIAVTVRCFILARSGGKHLIFLFSPLLMHTLSNADAHAHRAKNNTEHTIIMKVTGPIKLQMKWLSNLSQHLNRGTDQTY